MIDFDKEGFNLIYAKECGSPKSVYLKNKVEVIEFFINNEECIDFLSINDVIIDKNKLSNDKVRLIRFLKINKIYEI